MKTIERVPRFSQRRKVQLFVAAHVLAVTALYGVALVVGGGLAAAHFPPEVRVHLHGGSEALLAASGPRERR